MRDFLSTENARNKAHAELFTRMIQAAYGKECDVLIGHHLTFEVHGEIQTENEIPSADTLLFCHEIMSAVFGVAAIEIMQELASMPSEGGARESFVMERLRV